MGLLFAAFVARLKVTCTVGNESVTGYVNRLIKEDGTPGRNFIVEFSCGTRLYFRLEQDVEVSLQQ